MPRALHPHSPEDELDAHRAHFERAGTPAVLTPDIAAFCESGISVIVALGASDAAPVAGTGCGCRILDNGRMRLLLLAGSNGALLDAAERGAPVAATFSKPVTHRSIQIKGTGTLRAEPTEEDRQAALHQMAGLRNELREVEYNSRFSEAYCHVEVDDIAVVEFAPQVAFVQTPGPGAGAELKP